METKNYFSTDAAGNILPSATCYVYVAGTTDLATGLVNINGAPLSNPFTAQPSGLVQFKAPDGEYDLRVTKAGRDFTIRIQCFDGIAFMSTISEDPGQGLIPRAAAGGRLSDGWIPLSVARSFKLSTTLVDDFGADNTGANDSWQAFVDAIAYATANKTKLVGRGVYSLSAPVTARYVAMDLTPCDLKINHAGIGLIIGGSSNIGGSPEQKIGYAYRQGGATSVPTIRIVGCKDQHTSITRVDFVQMYADTDPSAQSPRQSGSSGYNRIDVDICDTFHLSTNESTTGSLVQWLNENTINVKRVVKEFLISGTYGHNHNITNGGAFEGTSVLNIATGYSNKFNDLRLEGTPTIKFGPGTYHNMVICNWYSSTAANPEQPNNATVVNDGSPTNCVITDFRHMREYATVAYTDISEVVLNGEQGARFGRSSDLQRIRGNSVQFAVQSEFIPVVAGDFYFFGQDFDAALNSRYRPRIDFYNEKLQPIVSAAGLVDSVYFPGSPAPNAVNSNSGQQRVWVLFTQATEQGAKFCKVSWTYGQSQLNLGYARALWIKRAALSSSLSATVGAYYPRKLISSVVSSAPISGFAPIGYEAVRSDGAFRYTCTFSFETSTASANAAGTTALSVSSASGVSAGDIVGVNLDDLTTAWASVSSVSGNTITLSTGLPSAAASGSRVVFNRWSAKPL